MLGALIAGGASLVSGLFGRSSAKKQARKEEKAIRDANEQAAKAAADMNKQVRARADAAALVPVQTARQTTQTDVSGSKNQGRTITSTTDRTRTRTSGGVDMDAFMAAAEENGFNPLTFLRSGALSLFATSDTRSTTFGKQDTRSTALSTSFAQSSIDDFTCTTGERAMDAALAGQYMPQMSPVIAQTKVPGIGDVLGNALTSGANQYLNDLNQQQNNQFQMDLLNRQLAGQNRPGSYSGSRSGYVPTAHLTGSVSRVKSPGGSGAGPSVMHGQFFPDIILPHGPEGGDAASSAMGEMGDWWTAGEILGANAKAILNGDSHFHDLIRPGYQELFRVLHPSQQYKKLGDYGPQYDPATSVFQ